MKSQERMKGKRRAVAMVAAVLTLLLAAACSSSKGSTGNSSTGSSGTSSSGTASAAAGVAAAQAAVEAAMKTTGLNFGLPTQSFKPGNHRVAIISAGQQTPAAAVIAAAQEAAAKAMGWTPSPIMDAALSTDNAGNFVRQAIAQGYQAIAFCCLDFHAFKGPIDEALAKGIALSCVSCVVAGYENKIHAVNPDFSHQGDVLADWLIASSNGKAKVVGMQDDAFPQVKQRMDEMASQLKANCPGCTYEKVNFSSLDLAKPGPPSWSAVLAQHPTGSITAAVAPYDAAAPIFLKTANQQGRTEIQINSFDLADEFAQLMTPANPNVGADIASPLTIMGWASLDQLARQLAGVQTWDSTHFPIALINKDNVSQIKNGDLIPSDFDYQAAFQKLWNQ
jgi:ribose transport system substrate-binding protein